MGVEGDERDEGEKTCVSFEKDSQTLKSMSIRIQRDEYDKT
jgi:hypothetical protein